MFKVLLEVSNLTGELALRRAVLSVPLFDLGKVLELDGLTLEDVTFHVLDQLLLFLLEQIILKLHSMDFLSHGDDLLLTNLWVESVLHLFLQLVLALPEPM